MVPTAGRSNVIYFFFEKTKNKKTVSTKRSFSSFIFTQKIVFLRDQICLPNGFKFSHNLAILQPGIQYPGNLIDFTKMGLLYYFLHKFVRNKIVKNQQVNKIRHYCFKK